MHFKILFIRSYEPDRRIFLHKLEVRLIKVGYEDNHYNYLDRKLHKVYDTIGNYTQICYFMRTP